MKNHTLRKKSEELDQKPFDITTLEFNTALPLNFEQFDAAEPPKRPPGEELGLDSKDLTLRRVTTSRAMLDLSKIKNAVDQIRPLPGEEESLHCIMSGDFHGWDLIPALHQLIGRPIDDLMITTLGFNASNNAQLCAMIDAGEVKRVAFLCSHYFKGADRHTYNLAAERLKSRGQRFGATRNHTKIVLMAAGPARYVVESSANLRSCNNVEQFALTRSRPLFEFHRGWILKILDDMKE